jgi:hypothetical protein
MIQEQKYNFAQIKSGTRKVSLDTKQSGSATDKKIVARSGTMSDTDFTTFINKLADNLSITLTPDKIKYFQAQRAVENTRAKNNPFATTWPGGKRDTWSADPDMTRFNSVGVKNFSNLDAGVKATADTLRLGHYTDLLNALRSNEDMAKKIYEPGIITALNKWGGGSYAPKIQSRYKSVRDTIPIKDKTDKPSVETEIDVDNNKPETADQQYKDISNQLIKYQGVIKEAYDDMQQFFGQNAEKYFGQFSSWYNDDELAAYKYGVKAYNDGWWYNKKNPTKSLENIFKRLKEIQKTSVYNKKTNIQSITDRQIIEILNLTKIVQYLLDEGVYKGKDIPGVLMGGRRPSIAIYRDGNFWDTTYKFYWNYM